MQVNYDCPLDVHCSYTRDQILVALDFMKPNTVREGTKYLDDKKTDLNFITLNNSDKPVLVLRVEVSMYMIYAVISLLSLFIVATCFFGFKMCGSFGLFLTGYLLVMISMFSIGMMVGGIAKNSKIAGVIASALYFPMLIFSGATLPYEVMPGAMQRIVDVLPLTQGIKILKNGALGLPIDNVTGAVIIMLIIAVICSIISVKFFRWE